jgi:hypothetical protein
VADYSGPPFTFNSFTLSQAGVMDFEVEITKPARRDKYCLAIDVGFTVIRIHLTPNQLAELDERVHDFIARETAAADSMA